MNDRDARRRESHPASSRECLQPAFAVGGRSLTVSVWPHARNRAALLARWLGSYGVVCSKTARPGAIAGFAEVRQRVPVPMAILPALCADPRERVLAVQIVRTDRDRVQQPPGNKPQRCAYRDCPNPDTSTWHQNLFCCGAISSIPAG